MENIELCCSVCSNHVNISEFNIYCKNDSIIKGLTTNYSLFISGETYRKYLYPIVWEEDNKFNTIVYTICSYKCARLFWHNRDSDDIDESFIKKLKIA
jgi:hypothetical protein